MPVYDSEPVVFAAHKRILENGLDCIAVEGELDIGTSSSLRALLTELVARGRYDIVFDFDRLRYMDSTGLGVLVGAQKTVREHKGRIILICMDVGIQKLFSITGLSRIFDIFENEAELLQKWVPTRRETSV